MRAAPDAASPSWLISLNTFQPPRSNIRYMKQKLVLLAGAVLLSTALTSCYTDPFYGGYNTVGVGVGAYQPFYGGAYGLGHPGFYGTGRGYYPSRYYAPMGVASRSYGHPYRSYGVPSRGHSHFHSSRAPHHRHTSFSPGFNRGGSHFGGGSFNRPVVSPGRSHFSRPSGGGFNRGSISRPGGSFGGGSFHRASSSLGGHRHRR